MLGWTQSSSNDPLLNHYSVIAFNALDKTGELSKIALLRSEYPHLTWRDVKLILAESAKKHDYEEKAKYKASGVKYSDGSEQQYSYRMGFGLLDVANAFELAEGWKLLPDMKVHTYPQETPFTMPKTNTYTSTVSVDAAISFIESVTLEMNMEATDQTKGIKFHTLKLHSPSMNL